MRRALFVVLLLAAASVAQKASAQAGGLLAPVTLRAGPGLRYATLHVALAGSPITVLHATRHWAWAVVNSARGYVSTAELAVSLAPLPPLGCDQSYPYSGSGGYFGDLTALRHSTPLGALLGTHLRRGCATH